jgi:hypothetical protein
MIKVAKAFFLLLLGLFAVSCNHRSDTENVILGVSNTSPLKFTLVISDPVEEKSWTSDGKMLPDYYNPELLLPEDDEAALDPAMFKGGFPNALKFFVVVQGNRKAAVPDGKVALDDPDGSQRVFQNAGFDTSDPNINKDDLGALHEEPSTGVSKYAFPIDSKTQSALATQPCIFVGQEFERFRPKSHTIHFAYSNQPWEPVGAYQFNSGKESGSKFVQFATPNIGSGRTPSREVTIRLPALSNFAQYRLLVKNKKAQIMHDLSEIWSMDSTVQIGSYVCQNGAYVDLKRKGDTETIVDRNTIPSLENAASVELQSRPVKWMSFENVAFSPKP